MEGYVVHKCFRLVALMMLLSGLAAEADVPPCYPLDCPPTYFLVAEIIPFHNDSYTLLISDPWDIAHAYELAELGLGIGQTILVAYIELWDPSDGINLNRNYLDPNAPSWSWYVTEFLGFTGDAIELCDGGPTMTEEGYGGGPICYWLYTVVAALGTELDPWCYVLEADCIADFNDLEIVASHWLESGCEYPSWCGGADLNVSRVVDLVDFALWAERWLLDN
jgi:hypothetical protein